MTIDERIAKLEEHNKELEQKVEDLEFRINLIAVKSHVNQVLYEYNVSQAEYSALMDLMDEVRTALDHHNEYTHGNFEARIKQIFPNRDDPKNDYHFAEKIAQAFMEDGRWDEVFPALYGNEPKYRYYMESRKKDNK